MGASHLNCWLKFALIHFLVFFLSFSFEGEKGNRKRGNKSAYASLILKPKKSSKVLCSKTLFIPSKSNNT